MNDFVNDRNKILMNLDNLDYDEVERYCKKYQIPIPKDSITILAGLHKARLYVNSIPNELKEKSKLWLKENGFNEEIY